MNKGVAILFIGGVWNHHVELVTQPFPRIAIPKPIVTPDLEVAVDYYTLRYFQMGRKVYTSTLWKSSPTLILSCNWCTTMPRILERTLQAKCISWAKQHRVLSLKVEGIVGIPDRLFIGPHGTTLFIEFKRPGGGRVTEAQRYWVRELNKRHVEAYVVDNFDEFCVLIEEHLL
jgi:hypothetical protein